ncbi:MAG: hypothetical protein EXS13_08325 [Planctomycetes bacterium]|nr:hypothetical protein [Planctomycetota bacterium]
MARIEYKWDDPKFNTYDGLNLESLYSALPEQYKVAGKPTLVFMTSDLADDAQYMKNVDATTLMDENIQIGAGMFQQMKINGNKIKENNPFWKILGGKQLPRMVVVDAAGAKVGSVEGQDISPSKVFALMKRGASKIYKTDLETIVKESKTILTEIDQIEAKRSALETKKSKSTANKGAEWAKEEKVLNEQMKAVEARDLALKKKWNEDRKVTKA